MLVDHLTTLCLLLLASKATNPRTLSAIYFLFLYIFLSFFLLDCPGTSLEGTTYHIGPERLLVDDEEFCVPYTLSRATRKLIRSLDEVRDWNWKRWRINIVGITRRVKYIMLTLGQRYCTLPTSSAPLLLSRGPATGTKTYAGRWRTWKIAKPFLLKIRCNTKHFAVSESVEQLTNNWISCSLNKEVENTKRKMKLPSLDWAPIPDREVTKCYGLHEFRSIFFRSSVGWYQSVMLRLIGFYDSASWCNTQREAFGDVLIWHQSNHIFYNACDKTNVKLSAWLYIERLDWASGIKGFRTTMWNTVYIIYLTWKQIYQSILSCCFSVVVLWSRWCLVHLRFVSDQLVNS